MDPTLRAWLDALAGPDDAFVRELWRSVLRRGVEPEVLTDAVARLGGGMSRAALLAEVATSAEFERVRLLDDGVAFAVAARTSGERPRNLTAPPGTDERAIEIPWCLSRYTGERRVLDVGYAFAEPAYLSGLVGLGAPELVGVDLVAAEVPTLESVVADLRSLPFADGSFDAVIAISTLEHIGHDNTQYGLPAEHDDSAIDAALRELCRVLARGGRLLVTVPAGEGETRPEQAVLPPDVWAERFERAGFVVWEDELYELATDGWKSVRAPSGAARYGERGPGAAAVLCAELRPRTIGERLRLGIRDRRYSGDVRRVTG